MGPRRGGPHQIETIKERGRQVSEADDRFKALRESGYTGPIDQDGNRVDDVDEWIDQQLHGGR